MGADPPAGVGQADDGLHTRVAAVIESHRQIRFGPALQMRVRNLQSAGDLSLLSGQRRDADKRPAIAERQHRIGIDYLVQPHHALLRGRGHAVVGNNHQIGGVHSAARRQSIEQALDGSIDQANGVGILYRVRAMAMPGSIDVVEVKGDESRPGDGRSVEPAKHFVNARFSGETAVVLAPFAGPDALHRRFGTGPEHGGGANALLLGADPDRGGSIPPATVLHGGAIAQRKADAGYHGIAHDVVDDAMTIGMQAGDHAVMAGKGQRRKCRPHALTRHDALGREP